MTTCWCGTRNAYFARVYGQCSGTGSIECICGGDFCVCHNHGEVDCDGCANCEERDDLDDDQQGDDAA